MQSATKPGWAPQTFKDWIYGFFGNTMGSEYLEPYNRKIWKTDPSQMDASWVFSPGRLPFPALRDIISSIAGIKSIGYKEQQYFYYPKSGGIQALYNALLSKLSELKVEFLPSFTVTKISQVLDGWMINEQLATKKIINTLPLTQLPRIFEMPSYLHQLASGLNYTKDIVVGVALNRPAPKEQVLYVPSEDIRFHRLTWLSNLSGTTKEHLSNLIAETTISKDSSPSLSEIVRDTIDGLIKMRIIDSTESILFTRTWVNEFGYPIYDTHHIAIREQIFKYLDELGIFSVGRWGSWHYWNTDKVYEAVLNLVQKISL